MFIVTLAPSATVAASSYDDYLLTASNLRLFNTNNCGSQKVDLTYHWDDYVLDSSLYGTSFSTAMSNGTYGVSELPRYQLDPNNDPATNAVIVFWSEAGVMSASWTAWYGEGWIEATGVTNSVILELTQVSGACKVTMSYYGAGYISHNGGSVKSYLFTGDFNEPTGYEGAAVATSEPNAKYVAMGDSFSSGEGNKPFEYGSDESGVNECHRSANSYSRFLQNQLELGATAFVACSGATTSDVVYGGLGTGSWGEGPQLNSLSTDTEVVTITIGGNDLGFGEVMNACYENPNHSGWGCSNDASLINAINNRMTALDGTSSGVEIVSILDVLYEIREDAPNASIYIAGYPHLFGSNINDYDSNNSSPSGAVCLATLATTYDYGDAQWMNSGVDQLNGIIQDAATDGQVAGIDVTYVSPALFNSHANCDSSYPWIYPVLPDQDFNASPGSFHPDSSGINLGYAPVFESYLN